MRISDWSSDVCSSDLRGMAREAIVLPRRMRRDQVAGTDHLMRAKEAQADDRRPYQRNSDPEGAFHFHLPKRKVERLWAVASPSKASAIRWTIVSHLRPTPTPRPVK